MRAQGYNRVGISAALNTGQSILEICGSILVLALVQNSALRRLSSLGIVSLAAAGLSTIIGKLLDTLCQMKFRLQRTASGMPNHMRSSRGLPSLMNECVPFSAQYPGDVCKLRENKRVSCQAGGICVVVTSPKEPSKLDGVEAPLLYLGAQPTAGLMETEHVALVGHPSRQSWL